MFDMEEIVKRQTDIIINNCKFAKTVIFPAEKTFTIDNLSSYDQNKLCTNLKKEDYKNCIYLIIAEKFTFAKAEIINKFNENKKKYSGKKYHISKINDSKQWETVVGKKVLYVGSKESDIKRRLIQHLGIARTTGRSVYSLYLNDWWSDHSKIIIKIWNLNTNVNYDILQIIEDSLWEEIQPIFGKKGATFNKK